MKLSELKAALKSWEETTALDIQKKEDEAKAIKENEWECDLCRHINTWTVDDLDSAKCKQCRQKNGNIEEMIAIMSNKRYTYQEQREYDELKNESKYRG